MPRGCGYLYGAVFFILKIMIYKIQLQYDRMLEVSAIDNNEVEIKLLNYDGDEIECYSLTSCESIDLINALKYSISEFSTDKTIVNITE